jgi:N-acyl-L-homoserine lactone synthetase
MIKILTNADKPAFGELFDQMFRARAAVFHDRLGWNVNVRQGMEYDRYDEEEDPAYVVSMDEQGSHLGSLRLLPTTGETMLRNEFAGFFSEPVDVMSPTAWECTRFCVHSTTAENANGAGQRVSSELLIGLCDLALSSGIVHIVGLYETHMTRVYRRIGWSPEALAHARPELGKLIVGIWDASEAALLAMRQAIGPGLSAGLTKQAA